MDKINQNRHRGDGRGVKSYLLVFSHFCFLFIYLCIFYLFNFTVGWNYSNLTFLFFCYIFYSFSFLAKFDNNFFYVFLYNFFVREI